TSIVATIWLELFRTVDASRRPRLSQGGLNQATAVAEKLVPVSTTSVLKKSEGGLFGFHLMFPASADVMTATGLSTNSGTAFEGTKLGVGFTTATSVTAMRFGGIKTVAAATDGTFIVTGADRPPPGCGFATEIE